MGVPAKLLELQPGAITPVDASVDAVAEFVRELIRSVGGRLRGKQYEIDRRAPVRTGLRCVSCRCITSFGRLGSVLMFGSDRDFKMHQTLVTKTWFEKYRAEVWEVLPAAQTRDDATGIVVGLPNVVLTEQLPSIDEVLGRLPPINRSLTVDAIARELAAQLADLHGRRCVLGGVTRMNVVQRLGTVPIWTFREYCCYAGDGKDCDVSRNIPDVRLVAPENGPALRRGLMVKASTATDIWQLGMLLFELYTGRAYWPEGTSYEDVVTGLSDYGGLPHERDPTALEAVKRVGEPLRQQQQLLARMLYRQPEMRPDARTLEREFTKLASDLATVQGDTVAAWENLSDPRLE